MARGKQLLYKWGPDFILPVTETLKGDFPDFTQSTEGVGHISEQAAIMGTPQKDEEASGGSLSRLQASNPGR